MERHQILQVMLVTGQSLSVGVTDLKALLLKLIVLSVKYVSKRDVWSARFGEDYVDWNLVDGLQAGKSLLGGTAEWLALLDLCKWEDLSRHEGGVHALVRAVRKHMKECGLDTGDATGWTLACKIFLIMLLQGLSSLHALEILTCTVFKVNTHAGCTLFLAKQARFSGFVFGCVRVTDLGLCSLQAENLHAPALYEAALLYVLDKCEVDTAALEQTHQLMLASADDRKLSLKMSRLTVVQGRPRLRDRVTSEFKTEEKKAQTDARLETWDSYTGYCWKHQFPPTLSEKIRSKLYFLASQTRWAWAPYVEAVLTSGGALCSRVGAFPVGQPDVQVLCRVIERLSMDGSPPFKAMTDFRAECFGSFPVTHTQRMTLSQVSESSRRRTPPAACPSRACRRRARQT